MKINEVILKLIKIQNKHSNIDLIIMDSDFEYGRNVQDIDIVDEDLEKRYVILG